MEKSKIIGIALMFCLFSIGIAYAEIDKTISDCSGKSIEYNYCNENLDYSIYIKSDTSSDNIIEVRKDSDSFKITPVSIGYKSEKESLSEISISEKLNVQTSLDKNNFEWTEIFGKGISFKYSYDENLFQKYITINSKLDLPVIPEKSYFYIKEKVSIPENYRVSIKEENSTYKIWDMKSAKITSNSINLIEYPRKIEDTITVIPKAFVVDNKGDLEYLDYSLEPISSTEFYLSILLPYEWVAKAVFPIIIDPSITWANSTYKFRRNITIENPIGTDYFNMPLNVSFDTATEITSGNMEAGCPDILVATNSSEILNDFAVTHCNTATTNITFLANLSAFQDVNYTLYYGNPNAVDESKLYQNVFYRYENNYTTSSSWANQTYPTDAWDLDYYGYWNIYGTNMQENSLSSYSTSGPPLIDSTAHFLKGAGSGNAAGHLVGDFLTALQSQPNNTKIYLEYSVSVGRASGEGTSDSFLAISTDITSGFSSSSVIGNRLGYNEVVVTADTLVESAEIFISENGSVIINSGTCTGTCSAGAPYFTANSTLMYYTASSTGIDLGSCNIELDEIKMWTASNETIPVTLGSTAHQLPIVDNITLSLSSIASQSGSTVATVNVTNGSYSYNRVGINITYPNGTVIEYINSMTLAEDYNSTLNTWTHTITNLDAVGTNYTIQALAYDSYEIYNDYSQQNATLTVRGNTVSNLKLSDTLLHFTASPNSATLYANTTKESGDIYSLQLNITYPNSTQSIYTSNMTFVSEITSSIWDWTSTISSLDTNGTYTLTATSFADSSLTDTGSSNSTTFTLTDITSPVISAPTIPTNCTGYSNYKIAGTTNVTVSFSVTDNFGWTNIESRANCSWDAPGTAVDNSSMSLVYSSGTTYTLLVDMGGTAGTGTVTCYVKDNSDNIATKTGTITIVSSCPTSPPVDSEDNGGGGCADDGDFCTVSSACCSGFCYDYMCVSEEEYLNFTTADIIESLPPKSWLDKVNEFWKNVFIGINNIQRDFFENLSRVQVDPNLPYYIVGVIVVAAFIIWYLGIWRNQQIKLAESIKKLFKS